MITRRHLIHSHLHHHLSFLLLILMIVMADVILELNLVNVNSLGLNYVIHLLHHNHLMINHHVHSQVLLMFCLLHYHYFNLLQIPLLLLQSLSLIDFHIKLFSKFIKVKMISHLIHCCHLHDLLMTISMS